MKPCNEKYEFRSGMIKRCERPAKHKGEHSPFKSKLRDQFDNRLRAGDEVVFISDTGSRRPGIVQGRDSVDFNRVSVIIEGDPFAVGISPANLIKKESEHKMPATQVKTDKKALRSEARKLKIEDYKEMTVKELKAAIKTASSNGKGRVSGTHKVPRGQTKADKGKPVKPSQKKTATKTKATKEVPSNGNPFRAGSNNFYITEEFIKGGNRAKMIQRLLKKIEFRPHTRKAKDLDPEFEMDKRLMMAAHQLQHKHGFTIVHIGRGAEKSTIRAFPSNMKVPAELKAKATKINKPGDPINTPNRTKVRKKTKKAATKSSAVPRKAAKGSKKASGPKTAAKSKKSTKRATAKK